MLGVETEKHTSGTWSMVAIAAEIGLNLTKVAWMMARSNGGFARVWSLGGDGVSCWSWLRKEGESKKAEWVRRDTIGLLYKTWAGKSGVMRTSRIEQLQRGKPINWNSGIKPFYPKIGGHVFTPKFGRRTWELIDFQVCANQGIGCMRIDISWFGCDTRISSL